MAIEIIDEIPVIPQLDDRFIVYRPTGGATPEEKTVVIKFDELWGPIVNVQTSRNLLITDNGRLLRNKGGSSEVVLTIPLRSSVNFGLIGGRMSLFRRDSGTFTVTPASGVLLNDAASPISISVQFRGATLIEDDLNSWIMVGA